VEIEDDDDDYYGYYKGGWVDTNTKEEPMEMPEDHADTTGDSNEDAQEEMVPIQVPQKETMLKMVMMTQLHPMVVTMMIQSQPIRQMNRDQSPITRSRYIVWTLLKVHYQYLSGGPCRESASH
jgi:hypothetical protein